MKMKIIRLMFCGIAVFSSLFAVAVEEPMLYRIAVLPETFCTLKFPLRLGFQLGIPAGDNNAFFSECFSSDALRNELSRLNEQLEIGLLVSHIVDQDTGEIVVKLSNEAEEAKGITLRTGYLMRGRCYTASVQAEKVFGGRAVILRVQHEHADEVHSVERQKIPFWRNSVGLNWQVVPEMSGFHRCTFMLEPGSTLKLHDFSLLPDNSPSAWRRESIDTLRNAGVGALRWPVVDGMDFYNWYDGIGVRDFRVAVQPEKTGLKQHDFGTAEYVDFCLAVGVEPLICVPLYTPQCADERVRNLREAAQIAADWVAYCNLKDTDHPLVKLRNKNGRSKPFAVRHWELNVPSAGALLSTEMIVAAVVHTVNAMKDQDPEISMGVSLAGTDTATLAELLRQAGPILDFVSSNAPRAAKMVAEFNRANKSALMYAATGLQSDYGTYATGLLERFDGSSGGKREHCRNWYRSLGWANAAVSRLASGQDGPVCMPYHAEQVLELDYGTARLSTDIALLSAMIGRFPAVEPLRTEVTGDVREDQPSVYAARTADPSILVVYAYNPADVECQMKLDLSAMGKKLTFGIMDQLSGDINATLNNSELRVERNQQAGAVSKDRCFECSLGPASFSRILIKE
jgi:hypothetical protein